MNFTPYDGTKLLSLKDINGNKPELILSVTNRTAGKTTYFSRLLINRFKRRGEKFGLILRYTYELADIANKFFNDIKTLFFQGDTFTDKNEAKGAYKALYLNDVLCGYAFAINTAEALKRCSHVFNDISTLFFDEFQSESGRYCSNEIGKFMSLHTTVARGQGKAVRSVPVYMCSNAISVINPYYTALHITERLTPETKFLRGEGFVLEQTLSNSVAILQEQSPFNRAFRGTSYASYLTQLKYLNDNTSFICKLKGNSKYLITLRYKGQDYGIREFTDAGLIYCSTSIDATFHTKLAVTTEDHQINYVMLNSYSLFIKQLREYFNTGICRFQTPAAKDAFLAAISY